MLQLSRILVPVDFSEHAAQAFRHAYELAIRFEAMLEVVHVIEEPTFPSFYSAAYAAAYGASPDLEALAGDALESLVAKTQTTELRHGIGCFIRRGHAAEEILHIAEEHGTDLVVIASHGLTGLERLLLGSVANKVVQGASCPVLIVKAFGKSLVAGEEAMAAQEDPSAASRASSSRAGRSVSASTMPAAK